MEGYIDYQLLISQIVGVHSPDPLPCGVLTSFPASSILTFYNLILKNRYV